MLKEYRPEAKQSTEERIEPIRNPALAQISKKFTVSLCYPDFKFICTHCCTIGFYILKEAHNSSVVYCLECGMKTVYDKRSV